MIDTISARIRGPQDVGLYISLKPDQESVYAIVKTCKAFGIPVEENELHVTLLYDKTHNPVIDAPSKQVFRALSTNIKQWDGHNNKGYTVLALESFDLHEENKRILSLGGHNSFPEYNPHVTLGSGITNADPIAVALANLILAMQPIELTFTGWATEPINN